MDSFGDGSVGWCDVEVAPPRPPPRRPREDDFFPGRTGSFHAPPTNLTSAFQPSNDAVNESEPDTFPLNDYLQSLILRVEGRSGSSGAGGPFFPEEIAELSLRTSRDNVAFERVDSKVLSGIVENLYEHVLNATSVSVLNEASRILNNENASPSDAMAELQQWVKTKGTVQVESLRRGIEAASILLRVASSPHADARMMIHEEVLQAIVSLFRLHLTQHIIPSWNQTGPKTTTTTTTTTLVDDSSAVSPKKRRRSTPEASPANSTAAKEWKKLHRIVVATISPMLVLMERLQELLQSANASLDDQHVLMMTNAATMSLEMSCQVANSYYSPTNTTSLGVHAGLGPQLQIASIDLLTIVFAKYGDHRRTILEDLLETMLKAPSGKRSLRAFDIRYTSTLAPQALSRRNTEWVARLLGRNYFVDNHQPHRIQMIAALMLQLLQSTVKRPFYESREIESDNGDTVQSMHLRSGLEQCKSWAVFLVKAILVRCSRKEASGAASEFRPILNNLVEDLLMVLLIPEYPAAGMMLMAFATQIEHELAKASESKCSAMEATYLNLAFDVLGKILTVVAHLNAKHADLPITMKVSPSPSDETHTVFECYCDTSREDSLVIECDSCKKCVHGGCVGTNREILTDDWICDACRLGRIAQRERVRYGSSAAIPVLVDEIYAMRQSFLATMSHRTGVIGLEPAIEFHLAHWADDLCVRDGEVGVATVSHVVTHGILDCWDKGFAALKVGETLTEEGGIRVILALLVKTSPLLTSFNNHLKFLVKLLSDNVSPTLRKLSVKAIERTVAGNHDLMTLKSIKKAVVPRLTDDSISVREAALSLVGSYVCQFPSITKHYHASLLKCISDEGVSVRKRSVKIFLEILTANPFYKDRADVFNALLQRAADKKEEDTVRDLIHDMLAKLWIEKGDKVIDSANCTPTKTSKTSRSHPSSPVGIDSPTRVTLGVVTPTPKYHSSRTQSQSMLRADLAARQMVEVVRIGGTGVHLEIFLKRLLGSQENVRGPRVSDRKIDPRVLAAKQQQCELLIKSMYELLLSIEESESASHEKDLVAVLQTIAVFADAAPESVHRHLSTVLPYFKGGNAKSKNDDALIIAAACDILSRISSTFERADLERLSETSISKDLLHIAYTIQPTALSAAMRAFSGLAHHRHARDTDGFSQKLLQMSREFYKYLMKRKDKPDSSNAPGKIRNNTFRAIIALSLVCRYHNRSPSDSGYAVVQDDADNEDTENSNPVMWEDLSWSNLIRACYELFSVFFEKGDHSTKCRSLEALGSIFMVEPRLMLRLEQKGFITNILAPEADSSLQIEAMTSWKHILIEEEKRIDGGHARREMEQNESITVSRRISGDQDGDSNIFGGILTSYAESIFRMTRATDDRVRLAAIELLSVIMRQGLVNPNEAVPHLFALQGDVKNSAIRTLACSLLMAEGEKRPDTLRLRICAGVKEAFDFQTKLRNGEQASALLTSANSQQKNRESIFDAVFRECISKNKKQRHGLFKNLLNQFQLKELRSQESPRKKRRHSKSFNVSLLGFTAEILAYLPYSSSVDPLFIIHQIRSLVGLQGEQVIDLFADVLRPVGLASEDKHDDRNAGEDVLERAAKSKFPSKTAEASSLNQGGFDKSTFAWLCQASVVITLLLRLKRYLRQLYNLSEARCLEFDPNEKEKIGEKGVSKSDFKVLFDASVAGDSGMDTLIRQYAEFRQLMRDESTHMATNNDSDMEEGADEESGVDLSEDAGLATSRKRKSSTSS